MSSIKSTGLDKVTPPLVNEWIVVEGYPSLYASFNHESLWRCGTNDEFQRLCHGIRQQYINENGPLANVKLIDAIRLYFDRALQNNDPEEVVRAYTAQTGFYTRLNEDLSQMPTHWSGTKHERSIVSILLFHPELQQYKYTGETHRGMIMSSDVGTIFMNKSLLSSSKESEKAQSFMKDPKSSVKHTVICTYRIQNDSTALNIESLSIFEEEKEVLILPCVTFKVKSIRKSI
uniref:ADP ribosyltransferase domain-containing protein n=1 Tax=Adineta vaga TaxID=104782 RepID=B3G492_ADIVA|nr:unknown [Adineta vaga]